MTDIHCPYCDRDFEIPELEEVKMVHKSDCEVYNEPAYPKGFCDCGADIIDEARGFLHGLLEDCLDDLKKRRCTEDKFKEMLVEEILVLKGNHFRLLISNVKK